VKVSVENDDNALSDVTIVAGVLKASSFRLLEPGEDLLSEGDDSTGEEEDDALEYDSLSAWRESADGKHMTPDHLQAAMDEDKDRWAGRLPRRRTSILETEGIAQRVEKKNRRQWAAAVGRRFPGRYVPYVGRAVRKPPSQTAADKARLLQRAG
jgi:hypothetical protein